MADRSSLTATTSDADAPDWQWFARDPLLTAEQQARGWLALRLHCHPAAVPLQRSAHGRPQLLAPHATDDVSWSHSGQGLLVAHACNAMVGIDLEFQRPRKQADALALRYFHPAEAAWILGQPDVHARQSAFIRLWCVKEAVLKAHGRGLAFGLDRLCFSEMDGRLQLVACDAALGDPAQWRLLEFTPHPGYQAAMAWYPGILPA
ncbi:MAG: 4'-phosphopantetheinyl transferase superfamily protein [Pseudomonadota bacterium]|nr:4'-phosphopantetheinyl transferase superfamily protein [Pseudomonadota bacterium]